MTSDVEGRKSKVEIIGFMHMRRIEELQSCARRVLQYHLDLVSANGDAYPMIRKVKLGLKWIPHRREHSPLP